MSGHENIAAESIAATHWLLERDGKKCLLLVAGPSGATARLPGVGLTEEEIASIAANLHCAAAGVVGLLVAQLARHANVPESEIFEAIKHESARRALDSVGMAGFGPEPTSGPEVTP